MKPSPEMIAATLRECAGIVRSYVPSRLALVEDFARRADAMADEIFPTRIEVPAPKENGK